MSIVFINKEGALQLDTSLLPGPIAFNYELHEEILRAVHSKFAGATDINAELLQQIGSFVKKYICDKVFPGMRGIDKVIDSLDAIWQLRPLGMKVDGDSITFTYAGDQAVTLTSSVFGDVLNTPDETLVTQFCLDAARQIKWTDPEHGEFVPTFIELKSTFDLAITQYLKEQAGVQDKEITP